MNQKFRYGFHTEAKRVVTHVKWKFIPAFYVEETILVAFSGAFAG